VPPGFGEIEMKRILAPALLAQMLLVILVPAVFAQTPTPRVTITGLFDQVTAAGRNFYDGNLTRDNDREWYARTRFRPDFTFEVGRVKAVLGLEIDLTYGQTGPNDGGFPGNNTGSAGGVAVVGPGNATTGCKNNSNGCLDLNTDVGGMIEIKWIYTEFPLTGRDSIMPFIPVDTMARAGGQPWSTLANYKIVYANGDFAGLSTITRFDPPSSSSSLTSSPRISSRAVTGRLPRRGRAVARTGRSPSAPRSRRSRGSTSSPCTRISTPTV
jgi:hypothetical protein